MASEFLALVGTVILVCMFASVGLWSRALFRIASGHPILPLVPRRKVAWDYVEILFVVGLVILGSGGSLLLLRALHLINPQVDKLENLQPVEQAIFIFTGSSVQLLIAAGLLMVMYARTRAANDGRLSPDRADALNWSQLVRTGIVGSLMFIPPSLVIQAIATKIWKYEHPLLENITEHPSPLFILVSAYSAMVVAPFAEEVFFRKLLQGWIESFSGKRLQTEIMVRDEAAESSVASAPATALAHDYASSAVEAPTVTSAMVAVSATPAVFAEEPWPYRVTSEESQRNLVASDNGLIQPRYWPIFFSAFMFALAHLGQGPAPFSLFVLALGLGYLYRQTHSIVPCVIVHLTLNSMTMIVFVLTIFSGGDPSSAPVK